MNENLCIAIITAASIFAGFLVAFLSSYLTARNKKYDENKLKFDTLGRKLTLFRQLCGFIWNSNCLNEQRGKLKANEPALDEDGNAPPPYTFHIKRCYGYRGLGSCCVRTAFRC